MAETLGNPTDDQLDPTNLGGNVLKLNFKTLGDYQLGLGTIGPENRQDINPETYQDMLERLASGEFNVSVEDVIPVVCVDGRTAEDGTRLNAPSGAGGTLGLVYARALADTGVLSDQDESMLVNDTVDLLNEKGHRTSVHGDNHAPCGCGACAKCLPIFEHISSDIEKFVNVAAGVGVAISDAVTIAENASSRLHGFFAENREDVVETAVDAGAVKENLVGDHKELAIAVNTISGTTIDRAAIREEFGPQYDLFVVDAWAFGKAAEELELTGYPEETTQLVEAMAVYNFATGSQLAHASMPIVPIAA